MSNEHDQHDDELLLVDEAQDEPEPQDEPGEFAIELEGEEQQDETPLVKQLRDEVRAAQKELKGYRTASQPAPIEVGPEPDIDAYDYDVDKWKADHSAWLERRDAAKEQARQSEDRTRVANEAWVRTLAGHRAKASALPVSDYDSAEATVIAALPETMQSALVQYTDDSAKVVYALAKHPAMLAKLAQETDPIKFVIAAREMEGKLKVTTRRKPPEPEAGTIQRGSAPLSGAGGSDKELAKLMKEAGQTGDYSKVVAYKGKK